MAAERSEILAWRSLLDPRYGTRTFEPAGSMRWEAGSFKLRNIGIGSVVFVGVNLMAQPCLLLGSKGWQDLH